MPALSPKSTDPFALLGTTLDQRYKIESVLGSGAHGALFAARHLQLQARVALKLLPPLEPRRRTALLSALLPMCGLVHPRLCPVQDLIQLPDGGLGLCSALLDGEDLATRVGLRGKLTQAEGLTVARQAAAGLWALHQRGAAHGNLSPRNLFLARYDDVALDDPLGQGQGAFGVRLLDGGLSACDGISATPADDQRALAQILAEHIADLTGPLLQALERAQDPQPQRRFASVQELWQALEGAVSLAALAGAAGGRRSGLAASTRTAVLPGRSGRPAEGTKGAAAPTGEERRGRAARVLFGGLAGTLLVLGLSTVAMRLYRPPQPPQASVTAPVTAPAAFVAMPAPAVSRADAGAPARPDAGLTGAPAGAAAGQGGQAEAAVAPDADPADEPESPARGKRRHHRGARHRGKPAQR